MKLENSTNTLDKIFEEKQEELGILPNEIKEKMHNISIEKIKDDILINVQDEETKLAIEKSLDYLTEDYEIKMSYFMENAYKKGFKDAFSLFVNCLEK